MAASERCCGRGGNCQVVQTAMSRKRRGRPEKDPENRRSKNDVVKVEPSRKEILRQEASRCGAPMTEVFRKNAFEEIEPQGRPIPRPNVVAWIMSVIEKLSKEAYKLKAEWLLEDLSELESELRMKAVEVQQRRVKREKWRAAAKAERVEEQVTFTLTRGEAEWLEAFAETKDRPLRTLLREAAFRRIRKREQMGEIEERLKGWSKAVADLREEEEGEGRAPQNEMRVRRKMRRLPFKMTRFVKEETSWGNGN